jgi:hypothetical protein
MPTLPPLRRERLAILASCESVSTPANARLNAMTNAGEESDYSACLSGSDTPSVGQDICHSAK